MPQNSTVPSVVVAQLFAVVHGRRTKEPFDVQALSTITLPADLHCTIAYIGKTVAL